mgnify:CR=1 FL=1
MNEISVELPIGIFNGENRYRRCVIRPMTGGTQKKLASKQVRSDAVKLLNTLLMDCVVSIDGFPRVTNGVISDLFIGDRDFLALEIRKISRGDKLTTVITCPHCNEKLTMTSDLSADIKINQLDGLEYTVIDGVPQFTIADPDSDFNAVFTFPNGVDQANAMRYIMKNPVEGTYALMYNCLISWNGKDPKDLTLAIFDELPIQQADFVLDEFQRMLPGPDFEIPAECPMCGGDLRLSLASSDFLFRLRE